MRIGRRVTLGVTTCVVVFGCGGTATSGSSGPSGSGGQAAGGAMSTTGGNSGTAATTGMGGVTESGGRASSGGSGGSSGSGGNGGDGAGGASPGGRGGVSIGGNGGAVTGGRGGATSGGNGGADATGAGGRVICPPCAAPPHPGCVGSGPCGCGPYICPDAGNGSFCSDQLKRTEGSPRCSGALPVLWEASSGNLGQFSPPQCQDLSTNLPRYCCTEAFTPTCPG